MQGLIRKIIIGQDPKNAMAYYVGMKAGKGEVSTIIMDDRHMHVHGKTRYLVYISVDGSEVLWKAVDEMPCIVEFDLNF